MKLKTILMMAGMALLSIPTLQAQSTDAVIAGVVQDASHRPLEFANVLLLMASDSSLQKAEITAEDGTFEMVGVEPGMYLLQVSYVGLPLLTHGPFSVEAGERKELPVLVMSDGGVQLAEATVTARKPLVEVHPDKTVFNMEGSINATGQDALELLRKAPGVVVDNNDRIILTGKNGVRVFINDKPTHLSGSDLANYLRTLQSSDIERIEIITNPPARYEAEGNAGIINIILKKDKRLGANGSANVGYSVGEKQRYNGGLSGNYRNRLLNVFGSYNYYYGENFSVNNLYREQFDQVVDQSFRFESLWKSHNARLGADFFLDSSSTIGFLLTGNAEDFTERSTGKAFLFGPGSLSPDSTLISKSFASGNFDNYNINLNYRYDGGDGLSWNIDADYGFFKNNSTQDLPNTYLLGDGSDPGAILGENVYRTIAPTRIDIYAFKIDHERPFLQGKLSAGLKYSFVKTDNDFQFFNLIENEPIIDPERTNHFVYEETVHAGYVSWQRQWGKWGLQTGLRLERTRSDGNLTALIPVDDQRVKRKYVDLFPSAGLTWQQNDNHAWQLTYSRRLDRPSYQDLNPFEGRVDELTFQKGNPFLNPQYTHSFQLGHTYRQMYNLAVGYSHTSDLITQLTDVDERDSSAAFITYDNLATQKNLNLTLSAPFSPTRWWNVFANLSGYRIRNQADFGDGKSVNLSVFAFHIYMQHSFNLPKGFVAELSGWYNSPAVWGGTFETRSQWSVDAGVQKKFLDERLVLKISFSDVFHTNEWKGQSRFGALYLRGNGNWDSQRLRLNLTWNFGNQQVKGARRRTTSLEEEQSRIKSGN